MEFKRVKYYLVMFMILFVMVLSVVAIPIFASADNNSGGGTEDIVKPPTSDETGKDDNQPDEPSEPIKDYVVFKSGAAQVKYGVGKFTNGKGIKGTYYFVLSTPIGDYKTFSFIQRNGAVSEYANNLELNWATSNIPFIKSYAHVLCTDGFGKMKKTRVEDFEFGKSITLAGKQPSMDMPYKEYLPIAIIDPTSLPFEIDLKTAKVNYFSKVNKNYYETKMTLSPNSVPDAYFSALSSVGLLKEINRDKMSVTMVMKSSKKTGNIMSISYNVGVELELNYGLSVLGAQKCTISVVISLKEVDKYQTIASPMEANIIKYSNYSFARE